jgi:hypothetical protein
VHDPGECMENSLAAAGSNPEGHPWMPYAMVAGDVFRALVAMDRPNEGPTKYVVTNA